MSVLGKVFGGLPAAIPMSLVDAAAPDEPSDEHTGDSFTAHSGGALSHPAKLLSNPDPQKLRKVIHDCCLNLLILGVIYFAGIN